MSHPIQYRFPDFPPYVVGGSTEAEAGRRGAEKKQRSHFRREAIGRDTELKAMLAVVRFLRWFAPRTLLCGLCGLLVEEAEYLSLYRMDPDEPVLAINAAHARCREHENTRSTRRVRSPCGCLVVLPTLVRVVSCGPEHEIGTVQVAPIREAHP